MWPKDSENGPSSSSGWMEGDPDLSKEKSWRPLQFSTIMSMIAFSFYFIGSHLLIVLSMKYFHMMIVLNLDGAFNI